MRWCAAWLSLAFLLGACAVREAGPDRVVVEHDVLYPDLAEREAAQRCARYGRRAVLVDRTPPAPSASLFYLQARTSVFECVEEL